jgi:flagellar protein FliO/FliZ
VSTIAIIGRMLLALVLVLGVMWALARWARKPMGIGKGERVMTVLARQQLSRSSSVAVLKLMDRALVLGVTEQGVQLLTETELAPIEQALTVPAARRPAPAAERRRSAEPLELDGELAPPALPPAAVGKPTPAGSMPSGRSKLDGSVLSPNTWKQVLGAARELTVRR